MGKLIAGAALIILIVLVGIILMPQVLLGVGIIAAAVAAYYFFFIPEGYQDEDENGNDAGNGFQYGKPTDKGGPDA